MDFRTFEQLHTDLARFESPTLFAYLRIKPTASIRESEAGLEDRHSWAQGQQDNSQDRAEATWFIQNFSRLRDLLLQSRTDYLRFIDAQIRSGGLDQLEMFILGALIHGEFTPLAEIAVAKQAEQIGIPADIAEGCLDRILTEKDLVRAGELPDHYSALGIHPLLPHEQLETFYKRRRKWINNITDRERFRRLSTALEAAWWVLGDAERRRLYDYQYQRIFPEPPPLSELAPITPESIEEPSTELDAAVAAVVTGTRPVLLVPKLVVEAPDVIRPRPARQPLNLSIVVKNTGRGEMAGTIRVDQPWASASPATLDPRQPEQTITVTVDPMAMPEDRGEVQVTIATRRCGNRTVLIEIRRKVYIKQLLTVGAVLTVAALVGFPLLAGLQHMATSTQTHLVVRADPPTGDIVIDGQTLGLGGVIDIHEAFPIDEPFTVRIEASGFQSWEEEVTVPEGELLVLTPRLELTDEMTFRPVASDSRSDLSLVEVTNAIEPVRTGVDTCITSETSLRGYVSPLGVLIGLDVTSGDTTVRDCLARQLRAVVFPRNTTTSYSAFEITL
ncbi:MAG: hypothetical protein P8R54_11090 [Myxococcota bacterium]|nr:hypothetical protein [Myxococcota bacterium]